MFVFAGNVPVILPPLQEQRAIAKILSALDSKIELLQKQNETFEELGQAIFKRWFIDFEFPNEKGKPYNSSDGKMVFNEELGKEIPEGWEVSTIGEELKTVLGGTPSRSRKEYWEEGNINWIDSGKINNFPVIHSSEKITKAGLNNSAAKLMPPKTVVLPFVISLEKEVKISLLGIESSGNQSVLGIQENYRFKVGYIYYWIQHMKRQIYALATGGAQQHINKRNIDETEFLIPDKLVIKQFNEISTDYFDKIINNSLKMKTLQQTRDALLPKLMSGKIRVPSEVKK